MNYFLVDHIDTKIEDASKFVCSHMPVDITIDNAYESMLECSPLGTKEMIAAFKQAVQYLEPRFNFNIKRFDFKLEDGRVANMQVRFTPTEQWPAFLMPKGELTINPRGSFAYLLQTPIQVAAEWASLRYVWNELRAETVGLNPYMLAHLMPWIRECLADFDSNYLPLAVTKHDRKAIDRELATVMRDWNVTFFPRLSKALTAVARSGKHLFGQFRMLEAAYSREALAQSCITVERTPSLIEAWMKEHMQEALAEWQTDKIERADRQRDELAVKAAKRLSNPKGK
jgi:hypothetical protein